jgi:23S rRNA (uracil1939-C5)-methyltransferase
MEFSFSQNKAGERFLGLVLAGTKGYVFNLTECHLVSPWMAQVLNEVRFFWQESGLEAYRQNDTGSLRTLTLREGKSTGDKLVILTVSGNPCYAVPKGKLDQFVSAVLRSFSESEQKQIGIFVRIQQTLKGSPTQFFEYHLFGKVALEETLNLPTGERRFHVSPTSFFQPNTAQAAVLYTTALNLVSWPKRHVLDLYAGAASLGIAMASRADRVTSIELNPYACCDAEINKELNALSNIDIICGDVGKELPRLLASTTDPVDLVVIDPPRVGLSAEAYHHLSQLKAPQILYISCNPVSQATDIAALQGCGYRIEVLQPVDSFPHTPHIENIALLSL